MSARPARGDLRGAILGIALLLAWAGSLAALLVVDLSGPAGPWIAVAGVLGMTWQFTAIFITAHDAMHGSVAPGRARLNHAIGAVAAAAYAMFDYRALRRAHGLHHATPARPGDPDWHDGTLPAAHESPFRWYLTFMLRYLTWGQWWRLFVVFWSLFLVVDLANLLLFWALPSVLSTLQLFWFGTYLPHRAPQPAGHTNVHHATSGRYSDVVSLLTCFHFGGYHLEHHEHPHVPWWQLPTVRGPGAPAEARPAGPPRTAGAPRTPAGSPSAPPPPRSARRSPAPAGR